MLVLATGLKALIEQLVAFVDPAFSAFGLVHKVLGVDIKGFVVLPRPTGGVEFLHGFEQATRRSTFFAGDWCIELREVHVCTEDRWYPSGGQRLVRIAQTLQ